MDVDLDPIPTPLEDTIQLKESCQQLPKTKLDAQSTSNKENLDIVKEFDVIDAVDVLAEDDDDKEFALLAAESLSKTPGGKKELPVCSSEGSKDGENWNAFEDK